MADGDRVGLSELASRFDAIEHMQEGMQILDRELRYLYLNAAAASQGQRSRDELLGRTLPEMYPGVDKTEMFARLQQCLRDRVPLQMENQFTFPDGSTRWFELRMEPVPDGVLLLSIDIERRRRLEQQLSHAQRMEAVGRLAGGIAHDFNNLLTIIQSYAAFIECGLGKADGAKEDARQIRQAAQRGAELTRQLLAISSQRSTQPVVIEVDETVSALEPFVKRMLGADINLVLAMGDAGRIRVEAGQLDQILLNLAANARDAMPSGGSLMIRTDQIRLDRTYTDGHLDVAPGLYAQVAVTDTGVGMDAETRTRIFEPFFTTKSDDGGTGLGLATSHGIVTQAGGHIWVYSEPGKGTTFKLYFPLADAEVTPSRPSRPAPAELRGSETILVVDDNASIVALCTRVLTDAGYTVLGADGPDEAVRFAERYSGPIHAVVADIMMPGGGGPDLVARLRQTRRGLPMLYMSGYIDDERIVAMNRASYLEKPFMPDELARKLKEVLHP